MKEKKEKKQKVIGYIEHGGIKAVPHNLALDFKRNKVIYFLCIPIIVWYIIFHYIPMAGIVMAFEKFKPALGIFRSKWIEHEKTLKEAIFNLLFKDRIEERDKKIKGMNVDELIDNLHDENGYGKFIVMEMKDRYDSLEDVDKVKILDTLSETTKANQKWAEGKRKQMKGDK